MKTHAQRSENDAPGRFEADLEAGISALFLRCPTLCGFSVRNAAGVLPEGSEEREATDLMIAEVSVYPLLGMMAPGEICHEIAALIADLIEEFPEDCQRIRERTFARILH